MDGNQPEAAARDAAEAEALPPAEDGAEGEIRREAGVGAEITSGPSSVLSQTFYEKQEESEK